MRGIPTLSEASVRVPFATKTPRLYTVRQTVSRYVWEFGNLLGRAHLKSLGCVSPELMVGAHAAICSSSGWVLFGSIPLDAGHHRLFLARPLLAFLEAYFG